MLIRDAVAGDLPQILAIHNHAVRATTAIWNDAPVTLENRRAWLEERTRAGYPVLVATEADGATVLGYASFGDWRAFDGYRHTVEHSVYVGEGLRGRGVGRALMTALIARARALDKHAMVAGIEAGNTASIRLHAALGFETAGTLREVGTKFGRWLDLTFMVLRLDDRPAPDAAAPGTPAPEGAPRA
ncbi:MAG: GNAT family N-acetyltransferase [Pseudomonadota bacterium]|nr:GNAT family N-acetyltransferase [Pseudomonadota bacterium]